MKYILYRDAKGHHRWRLVARNGRTMADSGEGYLRKRDMCAALERVKRSWSAPVVDETGD